MILRRSLSRSCKQKKNSLSENTKPKKKQNKPLKSKKRGQALKSWESSQTKPLLNDCHSSKALCISSVSTPVLRTSIDDGNLAKSDLRYCEVRLSRICMSSTQAFDQSSKHGRKPIKRKVSEVSQIIPIISTKGMKHSLKSTVLLCSCPSSEKSLDKFVTPQKQKHSKYSLKSAVTSTEQEFPITSTPMHRNSISKHEPNEISKRKGSVGRMASESSPIISSKSPRKNSRSSSKYNLRCQNSKDYNLSFNVSHSSEKLATDKVNNKKQARIFQSLTPVVKKNITKQVSSSSYEKKASKCNKKSVSSSKYDNKTYSRSLKKTGNELSIKSLKHLHARRKNVSDIPLTDLTLPGVPIQPRKVKSDNFKLPGKKTLKRKRYAIEALKKLDENYEDDIYQPQKFENFKDLLLCSPESNTSITMSTPKLAFEVTPVIRHKSPKIKDFLNPNSYAASRKVAEQCMYRKKKRKDIPVEIPVEPEKKKLEFSAILSEACKIQESIETMREESDEENSYFSFCD